jgi:hypothetical protein
VMLEDNPRTWARRRLMHWHYRRCNET